MLISLVYADEMRVQLFLFCSFLYFYLYFSLNCFLKILSPSKSVAIDNNQAIDADGMDMEIDLSNLGTVNTMFAALFR